MGPLPERKQILQCLEKARQGPLPPRELARRLGVSSDDYRAFRRRLRAMERDGAVFRQRKGGYVLPDRFDLVTGLLDTTRAGDGFVVPESAGGEDVFVPRRHLGSAVDGDRVAVRVERRRPDRNPEGRLVRVLDRARHQVVGSYHRRKGYAAVVAQEPRLPTDVFVPDALRAEARDGDVVLVRIREWGDGELRPVGEVERVLGRPGDPGLDSLAILLGQQIPLDFPPPVTREAEKVARRGIRPEDLKGREDFRETLCFTIDPEDARDHDDALSVATRGSEVEVGVHIADVSWYVKAGSAMDREALERGTSIYMVDRVIPMLPEPLSSDLCSLVAGQDRLTLSVVVRFDAKGKLVDNRVVRGVIRSRHRLSYQQAERLLAGNSETGRVANEGDDLAPALATLAGISRRLRQERERRGAIDFAVPEAAIELDSRGEPLRIVARERLEAHRLVEDLMILANESVARLGIDRGIPLIYRIHEEPEPDRIEALRDLAAYFGHSLPAGRIRPIDLAGLVESVRGKPHEYLLSTVALRSMKQARYSPDNVGHFGLASAAYVHFTSPIRRYPDLTVHRALVRWLAGRRPGDEGGAAERVARQCSQRERRAQVAERESVDEKKIRYMRRHVGDDFGGTISGVTGFGLFVLLDDLLVEGLVRLGALVDDYYRFDAEAHAVVGRRTRRRYRLGDRIRVQVVRVDTEARSVDLEPVEVSA